MRASSLGLVLLILAGCGSDNPVMDDAGSDSGAADSGIDAGSTPIDSGTDAGLDAGPSCTTGCAWVEVALGFEHTCARRENGEVKCWGRGQDGELGDDRERHFPTCPVVGGADVDCASRPRTVALDAPATAISARGGFSGCALVGDGDVWCWGEEGFAIGGMAPAARFAPEQFPGLSMISAVSDSFHTMCFLEADGTPLCAGENGSGQVGSGDFSPILTPTQVLAFDEADPTTPVPLADVVEIDTATFFPGFSCARTATTVSCWGSDQLGQLGTGTTTHHACPDSSAPGATYNCSQLAVAIPTADLDGAQVAELALGSAHACARMGDGTVKCWGQNQQGQLGVGDEMQRPIPTDVPGLTGVEQIVAGASHTCARLTDGTVSCWGLNNQGQVGDGDTEHGNCQVGSTLGDCVTTPAPVMGLTDVVFLAAGRNHTCAIREGGAEIWCWGSNDKLQLGDGPDTRPDADDRAARYAPVMVVGL